MVNFNEIIEDAIRAEVEKAFTEENLVKWLQTKREDEISNVDFILNLVKKNFFEQYCEYVGDNSNKRESAIDYFNSLDSMEMTSFLEDCEYFDSCCLPSGLEEEVVEKWFRECSQSELIEKICDCTDAKDTIKDLVDNI